MQKKKQNGATNAFLLFGPLTHFQEKGKGAARKKKPTEEERKNPSAKENAGRAEEKSKPAPGTEGERKGKSQPAPGTEGEPKKKSQPAPGTEGDGKKEDLKKTPRASVSEEEEQRLRKAWRIPKRPAPGEENEKPWKRGRKWGNDNGRQAGRNYHERRRKEWRPKKPETAAERKVNHIMETAKRARQALATLNNRDVASMLGLSVDIKTEAERRRQKRRREKRAEKEKEKAGRETKRPPTPEKSPSSSSLSSMSGDE